VFVHLAFLSVQFMTSSCFILRSARRTPSVWASTSVYHIHHRVLTIVSPSSTPMRNWTLYYKRWDKVKDYLNAITCAIHMASQLFLLALWRPLYKTQIYKSKLQTQIFTPFELTMYIIIQCTVYTPSYSHPFIILWWLNSKNHVVS
jgi:hypothetical protein